MAGVQSMLRDVYLSSKSCCQTRQKFLGHSHSGSTSVWVSHVLSNIVMYVWLSGEMCWGLDCVHLGVLLRSCVQSSIHVHLDIVPICLRYSSVCWLDKEPLASWHTVFHICGISCPTSVHLPLCRSFLLNISQQALSAFSLLFFC